MQEIPNNIAETILEQASKEAESRTYRRTAHDLTEVEILVARQGVTATVIQQHLDAFAAIPRSRAGKVRAYDIASFAAMILRDYDAGSVVFADVGGAGCQFEACLDYHHAVKDHAESASREGGQRHGREVVFYDPNLSDEWKAWTGQAKKEMSQAEFAAWIDEHLPDIADPRHLIGDPDSTAVKFGEVYGFGRENLWGYADPVKMVDLSRGLEIREGSILKSAVRLESGEVNLSYETAHVDAAGQPLKVPTRFLLSIPVFAREAAYLVPVKLSYKKRGGSIVWSFELYRPERFRLDAIEGMRTELAIKLTPATPGLVAPNTPPVIAPVVPIHFAKRASQG